MARSRQTAPVRAGLFLAVCPAAGLMLDAIAAPAVPAAPAATAAAPAAPDTQTAAMPAPSPEEAASAARGREILDRLEARVAAAKTIVVASTLTVTGPNAKDFRPVTVKSTSTRPGSFVADVLQDGKEIGKAVAGADGGIIYDAVKNRYRKVDKGTSPVETVRNVVNSSQPLLPGTAMFDMTLTTVLLKGDHPFKLVAPPDSATGVTVTANAESLNGKPVEDVTQMMDQGTAIHLYVDSATNVPVRLAYDSVSNGKESGVLQVDFSDFQLSGKSEPGSAFRFTPPATATAYTPPPAPKPVPILANGAVAPDFAVQAVDGKTVHLADFAGKVVVIDYWATWCGPCQASLPGTDKVAGEYQPKGVVFLPVCSWDEKSAFTSWVSGRKDWAMAFYFDPAGRGQDSIAAKLYKVSGIPTQFVIGKDGKVAAGFVGYDGEQSEKNLTAAIDKALAAS